MLNFLDVGVLVQETRANAQESPIKHFLYCYKQLYTNTFLANII